MLFLLLCFFFIFWLCYNVNLVEDVNLSLDYDIDWLKIDNIILIEVDKEWFIYYYYL